MPERPAPGRPALAGGGDTIQRLRVHIDAIDRQICALVRRRTRIARRVGAIRRSHGGPRVEPVREQEVRGRYANLGPGGDQVAEALLGLGRTPDVSVTHAGAMGGGQP